jgi:hypothetical protein
MAESGFAAAFQYSSAENANADATIAALGVGLLSHYFQSNQNEKYTSLARSNMTRIGDVSPRNQVKRHPPSHSSRLFRLFVANLFSRFPNSRSLSLTNPNSSSSHNFVPIPSSTPSSTAFCSSYVEIVPG